MKIVLEINNLTYSYPNKDIFNNLSFKIKEKSFVTITGANASGKTTLYKLLKKDLPEIKINDSIYFVGEETKYPNITVFEYLKEQIKLEEELISFKKIFDIKSVFDYSINLLSYNEKKYIEIFKSLYSDRKIIVYDNMFYSIDEIKKEKIFKLIKKIKKEKNLTIINITNNVEEIIYGTDVILLKDGTVLLYDNLKSAVTCEKEFKSCNLDLPFMASLSLKLKYYELIDKIYLNSNKLVNELWK